MTSFAKKDWFWVFTAMLKKGNVSNKIGVGVRRQVLAVKHTYQITFRSVPKDFNQIGCDVLIK